MAKEEKPKDPFNDFIEIGGEEGSMKPRDTDGEVIVPFPKKIDTSSVKDRRVTPRNRAGIELD